MSVIGTPVVVDSSGGRDNTGKSWHKQTILVVTNDSRDDQIIVIEGCGKQFGDIYVTTASSDPTAIVTKLEAKFLSVEQSLFHWYVYVDYNSFNSSVFNNKPGGGGGSQGDQGKPISNPTERAPIFKKSSEPVVEYVLADINGKPIQNTAGQVIKPPLSITRYNGITNITVNKLDYGIDFLYKVNDAPYTLRGLTFPAGNLLCRKHDIEEGKENGINFFRHEFELVDKGPDAAGSVDWHETHILSSGHAYYVDTPHSTKKLKKAVDKDGKPTNEPVLLDNDGYLITTPGLAYYIAFDFYQDEDYSQLLI